EILEKNKNKEKVTSLEEYTVDNFVKEEKVFENVVGQDSLTRFDRPKKSSRNRNRNRNKAKSNSGTSNNNRNNKGNKPGNANSSKNKRRRNNNPKRQQKNG
ncbi:hypothetical protein N9Y48_04000, partial [Zobellia sp.]|nr:hypothetical protein [Zobellia sp.]